MKVQINFQDDSSLTVEEVVRQARHFYGDRIKVDIGPDSSIAYDHVYFGLQQLITHEQLSIFYDKGANYHSDIAQLRGRIIEKITEIVDQVIIDNESRVAQ